MVDKNTSTHSFHRSTFTYTELTLDRPYSNDIVSPVSGSRRPSIASVHSASSIRSYSTRRYEKERQQKEEREMTLGKLSRANSTNRVAPTPSPRSTDDLLPTLEEDKQVNRANL